MSVDLTILMRVKGRLREAHPALRSVFRAVESVPEGSRPRVEVLLLVAAPERDEVAAGDLEYLREHWGDAARVAASGLADRGLQWREGVRGARGGLVCLMDDHDHVGANWFASAARCLEGAGGEAIVHPELVLWFGADQGLCRQRASTDPAFCRDALFLGPVWHPLVLARRELLLRHPYGATGLADSFGSGDWDFACATLAEGIAHVVAKETVCFVRRLPAPLRETWAPLPIARPSPFFDRPAPPPGTAAEPPREPAQKRGILGVLYRPLYHTVKPIAKRYPRWNRLGVQIADAFRGFVRAGENSGTRFPSWFLDEWRRIHDVEPDLFPEDEDVQSLRVEEVRAPDMERRYRDLTAAFGTDVSHVLMVPWIRRGGADLTALNYLRALVELGTPGSVVLLCTEDAVSEWRDRVPEQVRFVEWPGDGLDELESEHLLARLLLQLRPAVIHNVNSGLAWQVFSHFGGALRQRALLFGSTFCTDLTDTGRSVGYPVTHFRYSFRHLTATFSDSAAHTDELAARFAFDRAKMLVHYQPVAGQGRDASLPADAGRSGRKGSLQVLWAGRLDRQKRPDILAAIARACADAAVHFHVYGASMLDGGYDARLRSLPNLTRYGEYDRFASLPLERFDLYLYTSEWDGLPNVLLESAAAGLPILAPAVGGIPELVRDGETGFLVPAFDDIASFANRIAALAADRSPLGSVAEGALQLVASRHSWARFLERLREAPGYLSGITEPVGPSG